MTSAPGTENDRALRRDVALANRILERFGLSNAFGHASARIPGTATFYFPTRRSPGFADENRLLVLDTEGRTLSGEGTPNSELWIHARIYAARPEVGGVVHAHPQTDPDPPERVIGIIRNNCSGSIGTGDRNQSVRADIVLATLISAAFIPLRIWRNGFSTLRMQAKSCGANSTTWWPLEGPRESMA